MELKKGNYKKYKCQIKDKNSDFITNLESCENIIVGLKLDKTQELYDVEKTLLSGDVDITSPISGEISFEFNSPDTELLEPGLYSLGIELQYTENKHFEIKLQDVELNNADSLMLLQDVVHD